MVRKGPKSAPAGPPHVKHPDFLDCTMRPTLKLSYVSSVVERRAPKT